MFVEVWIIHVLHDKIKIDKKIAEFILYKSRRVAEWR